MSHRRAVHLCMVSAPPHDRGSQRKHTGAARLLAAAGQTGRVDPATFGIGALMVGDEANGPRLGRDSRRRGSGRRMHSVCVGGEDGRHPSQLHRVQNPSLGRVDRGEEAGQPRGEGESEHLRGAVDSATGGRGTVRLGTRWRDVAWPGEGAAGGDAMSKHADGRKPSRVMADYRGYPWPAAGA